MKHWVAGCRLGLKFGGDNLTMANKGLQVSFCKQRHARKGQDQVSQQAQRWVLTYFPVTQEKDRLNFEKTSLDATTPETLRFQKTTRLSETQNLRLFTKVLNNRNP